MIFKLYRHFLCIFMLLYVRAANSKELDHFAELELELSNIFSELE